MKGITEKIKGLERFHREKGCQVPWVEGVREMFLRVMGRPNRLLGEKG